MSKSALVEAVTVWLVAFAITVLLIGGAAILDTIYGLVAGVCWILVISIALVSLGIYLVLREGGN